MITMVQSAGLVEMGRLPTRGPDSWGCRKQTVSLQRGKKPPPHESPGYDTKQSDGQDPTLLELRGMWSTPLFLSLPGSLWPGLVASDKVLSKGQIELNGVLMIN